MRTQHAHRYDKVFDWDDPPATGHPGQAWNCRCRAEPHLLDEPPCKPDWQQVQFSSRQASSDGSLAAFVDFGRTMVELPIEMARALAYAWRINWLLFKDLRGTLSPEERDELDTWRNAVLQQVEQIKTCWRDLPDIAEAAIRYMAAIHQRPEMVIAEYFQCRATEDDISEATFDRAYMTTMAALNVTAPARVAAILKRRGHSADSTDLRQMTRALRHDT